MQPLQQKPKVVLHLDINKTLIAEDKNNGKDLHLVISTAIAEKTTHEWKPGKITSYYDYIKGKVPGNKSDKAVKKRRLVYLNEFIKWMENQKDHPKREEVLNTYNKIMEKMEGQCVFPSFFKLIKKLRDEKYDFTIVLRTFGKDRKFVVDDIERKTSLKFHKWGEFKEGKLHLEKETVMKTKDIYKRIIGSDQHLALKDNWKEWNAENEKAAFGKRFIFDPKDPNIISLFIDDNIKADGTEYDIVSPYALGKGVISIKEVKDKYIFAADTLQAIEDEDYFIKIFDRALKNHLKSQFLGDC